MALRLLVLTVFLAACESTQAVRVRSTEGGGAYLLNLQTDNEREIGTAVRGIIDDMQKQCHGNYEVVGIDAEASPEAGYYLAADDAVANGPYRTRITYECGEPAKTAMNHRLYLLAGPSIRMGSHGEHLQNEARDTCVETWDCPAGVVCEPRPCATDEKPAK
ncbi:MAG TPA: hypothetical protein VGH20_06525 [Myxococcales bacterium]|jgi:hypothetical protein